MRARVLFSILAARVPLKAENPKTKNLETKILARVLHVVAAVVIHPSVFITLTAAGGRVKRFPVVFATRAG